MKSAILTLAALVATVAAQDVSGLPQCGQTCVNNMLADEKAEELGCENGNAACLCLNPNFTYGVRDCSLAICDQDEVEEIVERAIGICSSAGVAVVTDGSSASASRTAEAGSDTESVVTVTGTVSTIYSVISSDGSAISTPIATTTLIEDEDSNGGGAGVIVTTLTSDGSEIVSTITSAAGAIVTTITSDGSEIISTITSGAGGLVTTITSDGSEIISTITSPAGSVASSIASDASDILSSASDIVSSIVSDATSAAGDVTSTEADGAAVPQKTAAPIGIIAAAGLAAFLL